MKDWAAQRERDGTSAERDQEFSFLSFRLRDTFIDEFRNAEPAWGFPMGDGNTLGEYTWLTKYSRLKADGTKERFWEGLRRVIEGMYSIQKDHALRYRLPWNEETAHRSASEAYARAFAGKWSPPGRGFWMMGTAYVNERNDSSPLQNCGFLSTAFIEQDLSKPFTTLMNMSMLGVGVGFDTLGAGKIVLNQPAEVSESAYGFRLMTAGKDGVSLSDVCLKAISCQTSVSQTLITQRSGERVVLSRGLVARVQDQGHCANCMHSYTSC